MNPLVYHIASGQCFFSGIALLVAAAFLRQRAGNLWRRLTWLAMFLGLLAVTLSSTAIPYWFYAIAIVATLPWFSIHYQQHWLHWAPHAMIAAWLIAAAVEVPYHALPTIKPTANRALTILGDSVTAGVGDDQTETWPKIIAREHQLEVQDISHVGETAASALKRIQKTPPTAPLVIVEIGGNDLLGSTTSAQFDHDLNALLAELSKRDCQIIMFELPLPPFYHEYGRVQRAAAKRHHVALIPKRGFLSILAGNGSTLDSIHLSQAGHQRMAEMVWQLIEPAVP
ncbi:SGNH/GDSL hydrolase family protein [Anatilimnocola floriformis]|uniref:SGNH/GDSL hydrolase family protein n=1 Tax=Anatilimnocola floriformis TaxID=2948575 RepID=UPI0020C397D9|nr:GDSL-type esterase/lipase family protein [Anatilimnocola floriformis]